MKVQKSIIAVFLVILMGFTVSCEKSETGIEEEMIQAIDKDDIHNEDVV